MLMLTEEQLDQFMNRGYLHLKGCVPRATVDDWVASSFEDSGWSLTDGSTWPETAHVRALNGDLRVAHTKTLAPVMWQALCELMGEDRIDLPALMGSSLIVTFPQAHDGKPWLAPSPQVPGWHKDGFFKHFLDSPEQGMLSIVLWSDIRPQGGGTFIATDSVPVVARALAANPQGVDATYFYNTCIKECREFLEVTGDKGDVFLLHPYMLHTPSRNHSQTVRIITNPPVSLREPMQFNREDPAQFSVLEKSILAALGVDRLDYRATGERARLRPDGSVIDREAERVRLASLVTD